MEILELIRQRHSVRKYLDKPIEEEKKNILNEVVSSLNKKYGTHVQVFYDDIDAFKNATTTYGSFSGCKNIIALVGNNAQTCGYVGELLVLKAQELGLNTCFVGLTYNRGYVKSKVKIMSGEKVQCSIALGYGETQGVPHKSKSAQSVLTLVGEKPEKLDEVVQACLLAPTAINQQKFKIICTNGKIEVKKAGIGFYRDMDLGIVKSHVDLVLGKITL